MKNSRLVSEKQNFLASESKSFTDLEPGKEKKAESWGGKKDDNEIIPPHDSALFLTSDMWVSTFSGQFPPSLRICHERFLHCGPATQTPHNEVNFS
jgi:hypothetical protein